MLTLRIKNMSLTTRLLKVQYGDRSDVRSRSAFPILPFCPGRLMNFEHGLECEQILLQLGAREERVRQLERQVAIQRERWDSDAREWQRMQIHRDDLAEWLIDRATNDSGHIQKTLIDAGLGGESFVPGTFTTIANGRKYRFDLASTEYEIQEIFGGG